MKYWVVDKTLKNCTLYLRWRLECNRFWQGFKVAYSTYVQWEAVFRKYTEIQTFIDKFFIIIIWLE